MTPNLIRKGVDIIRNPHALRLARKGRNRTAIMIVGVQEMPESGKRRIGKRKAVAGAAAASALFKMLIL